MAEKKIKIGSCQDHGIEIGGYNILGGKLVRVMGVKEYVPSKDGRTNEAVIYEYYPVGLKDVGGLLPYISLYLNTLAQSIRRIVQYEKLKRSK